MKTLDADIIRDFFYKMIEEDKLQVANRNDFEETFEFAFDFANRWNKIESDKKPEYYKPVLIKTKEKEFNLLIS